MRAFAAFVLRECVCLLVSSVSIFAFASNIKPTTTLTAETSNNTSTASGFATSTNGNIASGNVSKVDHHTLLYPGASTNIYTHVVYWFGPSNHIQVGYRSNDAGQVQKQVDDQLSRGIDGTIVDWYGPSHVVDDSATQSMMRYTETLPDLPFHFAIMEDKGALLSCASTPGCDLNVQLVSDLTYIYSVYERSPSYMKISGQPAVFFFGLEAYNIDWDGVKASVPGNPLFIFENSVGYSHPDTAGAFSWVMINTSNPDDWKQSYLDDFYAQALKNPTMHTFGAVYKGFNDTLASWSLNRIMNQNCGESWLNTWNEVANYYSASNQLESVQIVTWNDYEEGTEIETGIENCVSLTASVANNLLAWDVVGNENTIDHYTIFVSIDGENLMALADTSRGIHAVDLSQFDLAPGSYTLFVKAIGRPSMTNKMSGPVSFTVATPNTPPSVVLSVRPTSAPAGVTITASMAGSSDPDGTIAEYSIDFGDGTVANSITASHAYAVAGGYTIKATAADNDGASSVQSTSVTITPAYGVMVTSPANGSTYSSPVHFVASATSQYAVTSMDVVVDGVSFYEVSAARLDTFIRLATGIHSIIVHASDSTGAVFQTPLTVTVRCSARCSTRSFHVKSAGVAVPIDPDPDRPKAALPSQTNSRAPRR